MFRCLLLMSPFVDCDKINYFKFRYRLIFLIFNFLHVAFTCNTAFVLTNRCVFLLDFTKAATLLYQCGQTYEKRKWKAINLNKFIKKYTASKPNRSIPESLHDGRWELISIEISFRNNFLLIISGIFDTHDFKEILSRMKRINRESTAFLFVLVYLKIVQVPAWKCSHQRTALMPLHY